MVSTHRLFFDPHDYFDDLVEHIERAAHDIVFEIYIFELDAVGSRMLAALESAIARGVRVRVLLDGVGSFRHASRIATRLQGRTCAVRIFHPLPWDFAAYRNALRAGRWYSQFLHFVASINRRDHRKLCIVDGRFAWLGSFNLTAEHFEEMHGGDGGFWHDTGLRVGGPLVATLEANFEQVWAGKLGSFGERSRRFLAFEARTRHRRERQRLLAILAQSRSRIWITNAYFNPSRPVLKLLRKKARQGLDLRVIVPSRSDIPLFPALSRSFYSDLLRVGIRVYEYRRQVLHSKTMLIDDQVLIGSTNLNYRSLLHDLELDVLLDDPEVVESLQRRFGDDIRDSREITLRNWRNHPLLLRSLSWMSRLLRYWT